MLQGAADVVSKPEGLLVEIRDYDIEGHSDEPECAIEDLPKDKDGTPFERRTYL